MPSSSRRKKSKRSPSSARDRTLGEIRAAVGHARAGRRGAGDSFSGINTFRENLALQAIGSSVRTLWSHPAYKSVVWPSPFPRTWNTFSDRTFRAYLSFEKELDWTAHALLAQATAINEFLRLKAQFDSALFVGDLPMAKVLLDTIEDQFGLSVWLAEARIACLQMTAGFKAQKEFVRLVTSQTSSDLVRFLVAWIALKHEENTSHAQLLRMIERFAGEDLGFITCCVCCLATSRASRRKWPATRYLMRTRCL